MNTDLLKNIPAPRPVQGLAIVRTAIALILIVHPIHGLIDPAGMHAFGEGLSADGFPFGLALPWLIVLFQFTGCVGLIFNRYVVLSCIFNLIVLIVGVFYIHMSSGWFVVGAGRNGVEYSITLIACLSGIMWAYWPRKQQ